MTKMCYWFLFGKATSHNCQFQYKDKLWLRSYIGASLLNSVKSTHTRIFLEPLCHTMNQCAHVVVMVGEYWNVLTTNQFLVKLNFDKLPL